MFFNTDSSFVYGNKNYLDKKNIYTPHPFTNWSLNPKFEFNNILEHTEEGFRKVLNFNSLISQLNQFTNSKKIYCMGGSTTYCTELYGYEKSWPAKLQSKLDINKSIVINGGVGGWGTLQSLIRFIGWASIIKPKIVILYLSKNDLTPFYVGRSNQEKVFPLLENVMLQFNRAELNKYKKNLRKKFLYNGEYINLIKSFIKRKNKNELGDNDLSIVYSNDKLQHKKGFERYDIDFLNSTILRYETVAKIIKNWNGQVLFITEIINQQNMYFQPMQHIHNNAKTLSKKYENFYFFDLNDIIVINNKNFLDNKMHFSEEGCNVFSEIVFNLLNKLDNNKL